MQIENAQSTFEQCLSEAGLSLAQLTVADGLSAMSAFYRDHRVDGCPGDADDDMLLYQWGCETEEGVESFAWNLTRQFTHEADDDDEGIWQLSLTFKFLLLAELRAIEPGNKWCPSFRPQAVQHFAGFVQQSAAFQGVSGLQPQEITLDLFNAG